MIELILPHPPSLNHFKRVGRLKTTEKGKLYQPKFYTPEAKRFFYEVWLKVMQERANQGFKFFDDATISLGVYIDLDPPDKRRMDIDNPIKIIFDSLVKAHLIADDSMITRLLVERKHIIQGGQIIVRVEQI